MKNRILSVILAVLCMLSVIPFTAVSAGDYYSSQTLPVTGNGGLYTFEGAWTPQGTWAVNGFSNYIGEKDGFTVGVIEATEETSVIDGNGEPYTGYELNTHAYGQQSDKYGNAISMFGAQYLTYEYYFEPASPDSPLIGKTIGYRQQGMVGGGKTFSAVCDAEVVANEWHKVVLDLKSGAIATDPEMESIFAQDSNVLVAQWKLYPFGIETGLKMEVGDKLYIKDMVFTSYDPDEDLSSIEYALYLMLDEDDEEASIFNSDDEGEYFGVNDTYVLPEVDSSLVPEGKQHVGYRDLATGVEYAVGSTFRFNTSAEYVELVAVFATPGVVYLAEDGDVDGNAAYTTLAQADAAIAAQGGEGVVLVEGTIYDTNADVHSITLSSSKLTIKAYDGNAASAKYVFGAHNTISTFNYTNAEYHGAPTALIFDDITIKRSDSVSSDEISINLYNVDLTFEDGCAYESGSRASDGKVIDLYIGQGQNNTSSGFTFTNNSPAVKFAQIASIHNWSGNTVATADYEINLNAGTVTEQVAAISRDSGGGCDKIVGNVNVNLDGATVNDVMFALADAEIDGSAIITVNSGSVSKVIFGANDSSKSITMKNGAVVINTKGIIASGNTLPTVVEKSTLRVQNTVYIVNNTELSEFTKLNTPTHKIYVEGGAAEVAFEGTTAKFRFVPDNSAMTEVLSGGVKIADSGEWVALSAGEYNAVFNIPGAVKYNVSYADAPGATSSYYAGAEVVLKNVYGAEAGYILTGYNYNETFYALGDKFVVPEADVTLEPVWVANPYYYYVASTGSDSNPGISADKPFATFAAAFAAAGTNDATIVVMGTVNDWPYTNAATQTFAAAADQTITVTGYDAEADKLYEGAQIFRGTGRVNPLIASGTLVLEELVDYTDYSNNNNPIMVSNGAIVLGAGYGAKTNQNGGAIGGTQLKPASVQVVGADAIINPTYSINGKVSLMQLHDWEKVNIGTVDIYVGPDAEIGYTGVVIGGDGPDVTNADKVFVTVDQNKSELPVRLGGYASNTSVHITSGVQVLLIDTAFTVLEGAYEAGTYTNDGATYVVTTSKVPDGCFVENDGLGKINIHLAEGFSAKLTGATETTVSESGTIEIADGKTNVTFTSAYSTTLNFPAETINVAAGDTVKLPAAPELTVPGWFGAWVINGEYYAAGADYTAAYESAEYDVTMDIITEAKVYVDQANGSDDNYGFNAESPVASFDAATAKATALGFEDTTFVVSGTYSGDWVKVNGWGYTLTIEGVNNAKLVATTYDIEIKSDVVLKNVGVALNGPSKHFNVYMYDLTIDEGVYNAGNEGKPFDIHLGGISEEENREYNQTVVLKSGVINNIREGAAYVTTGKHVTYTGNVDITIDGASVGALALGDGWGDSNMGAIGTHDRVGKVTINVVDGSFGHISNTKFCTDISEGIYVYNYVYGTKSDVNVDLVTKINAYVFNFDDQLTGTVEDGVLTVNKPAYYKTTEATVSSVDDKLEITAPGRYDIYMMNRVNGAQIRAAAGEVKQGLRFIAEIRKDLIDANPESEFGMIMIPTVVLGDEELVAGGVYNYNENDYAAQTVPAIYKFKVTDEYTQYTAVLTDIASDNYTTDYTVVTYIKNGDEYVYGQTYSTNVYAVAKAALAEHEAAIANPESGLRVLDENALDAVQAIIAAVNG